MAETALNTDLTFSTTDPDSGLVASLHILREVILSKYFVTGEK